MVINFNGGGGSDISLSAITFTANTAVTVSDGGYSAITVNVPTGQTYNIEQSKSVTATTNGTVTIEPSSFNTHYIFVDKVGGGGCYFSVYAESYIPYFAGTKLYRFNYINDETSYIDFFIGSGMTTGDNGNGVTQFSNIDIDDSHWNASDYGNYTLYTGGVLTQLFFSGFSKNNGVVTSYDLPSFDVMSAVTLEVNVPEPVGDGFSLTHPFPSNQNVYLGFTEVFEYTNIRIYFDVEVYYPLDSDENHYYFWSSDDGELSNYRLSVSSGMVEMQMGAESCRVDKEDDNVHIIGQMIYNQGEFTLSLLNVDNGLVGYASGNSMMPNLVLVLLDGFSFANEPIIFNALKVYGDGDLIRDYQRYDEFTIIDNVTQETYLVMGYEVGEIGNTQEEEL